VAVHAYRSEALDGGGAVTRQDLTVIAG
jgi:hypothetical protein